MFRYMLAAMVIAMPATSFALDDSFYGTYSLISSTRKIVATGEIVAREQQKGFITYTRDGRMLVLITQGGRPKPASVEKMTDAQRADLFRGMVAYGGTFSFDGKVMQHHIDISWNEVWTGITQLRDVTQEGGRLVYNTRPSPNPADGTITQTTLIWEKVK